MSIKSIEDIADDAQAAAVAHVLHRKSTANPYCHIAQPDHAQVWAQAYKRAVSEIFA